MKTGNKVGWGWGIPLKMGLSVEAVGKFGSSCILYGPMPISILYGGKKRLRFGRDQDLSKAESFSHLFWPAGGACDERIF